MTDHLPLFLLAFPAGVVSFLSPCVLPLVPPYLCFLAGATLEQLTEEKAPAAMRPRVLSAALAFVTGFSAVFIALGATASALGSLVHQALTWTVTLAGHEFNVLASLAGLAIIAMGLHFIGAYRIALFDSELRYHHAARPAGSFGAFLIGAAFAFGWTPCIGPVLATILAVAAGRRASPAAPDCSPSIRPGSACPSSPPPMGSRASSAPFAISAAILPRSRW